MITLTGKAHRVPTVRSGAVSEALMKRFWDARAKEDAFYFVDNQLRYRDPDVERFWAGGREAFDRMLDLLDVRIAPDDQIVEVGCGVGRITRCLAERGGHVRAMDVSEAMLEQARRLNPELDNVEWILGDGRTLAPIEADSTDVCHSFVVFQHIPDPEITLTYVREMGRVLRTGGIAFFQVSNEAGIHRKRTVWWRLRFNLLAHLGRAPRGQSHPAWRGSSIDLAQLRSVAQEAGLEIERVAGAGTQYCFVLMRKGPGRQAS
jgi:SAM-dependent methyltransferase